MLFEDVICILCVLYTYGLFWAYFAFRGARIVSAEEFVGGAVQPAFPEGRLVSVAVVGPVRRPPERRYGSISDSRTINDFIVLL